MKYWCVNCGDAVEPEYGWTDVQADESIREAFCPNCGRTLTVEADLCPICYEYKPKFAYSCLNCRAEIGAGFERIVRGLRSRSHVTEREAWDAMGEVFDIKYDNLYKRLKKEAAAK